MRASRYQRLANHRRSGRRWRMLAVLCLGSSSCSGSAGPLPSPATSALRWSAGDLHVHSSGASNDTDDSSFPQDIAEIARARGLDWVALTDHSNSTGSMHCADVEDCPNQGPELPHTEEALALSDQSFLMVQGSEISPIADLNRLGGPVGHVGCLPPPEGFDFSGAFIDRPPGAVDGAATVAECRRARGWAIINHPFVASSWIAYDWSSLAFDGLEVWNGGGRWDLWDQAALNAWECLIALGHSVVPVAGSDNHRAKTPAPGDLLNPPLGQPRTSVALDSDEALSWTAIASGLKQGQVRLHEEGSFVDAALQADGSWRISGKAPSASRVELRQIPSLTSNGCEPATTSEAIHDVLFADEVHGNFTLRSPSLDLEDNAKLYAFLLPLNAAGTMVAGVAMTALLSVAPP